MDKRNEVARDVFWFVPNLIGYLRIVLLFVGLCVGARSWLLTTCCYGTSQLLDAVDGWAARKYDQATKFGAILDQVTDRMSTLGLIMLNAQLSPMKLFPIFLAVVVCDVGGHWVHFFASVSSGANSHKQVPDSWPILKWYYEQRYAMFLCHGANEAFWVSLFVMRSVSHGLVLTIARYSILVSLPLCLLKNWTNFSQMLLGSHVLAELDSVERNNKKN